MPSKRYFRIIPRREHPPVFPSGAFAIDEWTCLTDPKHVTEYCTRGFTHFEFTVFDERFNGRKVRVNSQSLAPFPRIVTLTRDHAGFEVCTTFDVDFVRPWPVGTINVRRDGAAIALPSKYVAEAHVHAEHIIQHAQAV